MKKKLELEERDVMNIGIQATREGAISEVMSLHCLVLSDGEMHSREHL